MAYSYRSMFSLGRVTMAYQWSRKLAAEVELYVTNYTTKDYAGFGSDEAVSSTSLLFGLTFKPLAPASLQPHSIEIGAAAGPSWIRTSVSEWWGGEDSTVIDQRTKWTARVRVSYDYHFSPWFSIGVFGEYRWLQADVPSYVMTEVTLPARTITMGGSPAD